MTYAIEVAGTLHRVDLRPAGPAWTATVDGVTFLVDVAEAGGALSVLVQAGATPVDLAAASRASHEVRFDQRSGDVAISVNGVNMPGSIRDPRHHRAGRGHDNAGTAQGRRSVLAPMPGRVVKLLVTAGEQVAVRQGLLVIEAMKMENELRSPKAGTVVELRVTEGMSVEANALLAVVE